MVVAVLQQHLGRDVGEGAADAAVERPAHVLRETEVEDLEAERAVLALDEAEVGGLDVEVDDAVTVDVGEPGSRLQRHRVEGLPVGLHAVLQVGAGEQLHGQERELARQHAEVVDLDDVGVTHLGEQPHLVLEAVEVLVLDRLQRHLEGELAVGAIAGADAVDDGARRAGELLLDEEVAEQLLQLADARRVLARAQRTAFEGRPPSGWVPGSP